MKTFEYPPFISKVCRRRRSNRALAWSVVIALSALLAIRSHTPDQFWISVIIIVASCVSILLLEGKLQQIEKKTMEWRNTKLKVEDKKLSWTDSSSKKSITIDTSLPFHFSVSANAITQKLYLARQSNMKIFFTSYLDNHQDLAKQLKSLSI